MYFFVKLDNRKATGPGGGTPIRRWISSPGYQVPVNRPQFFTPILHPMTPFFYSLHTQWPPFFHFCIKFYIKIANLSSLSAHFEKFNNFVAILTEKLQILPWNCIFAHWMTPIFGSPHQKSPHFFGAHTEWPPFFDENLTLNAPYFRSPVGTCTSLSYLSDPRGYRVSQKERAPLEIKY